MGISSRPRSASPCKSSASEAMGAWPTLCASSSLSPLCTASGNQVTPPCTARFSRRWYASSADTPACRVKRELTCTGPKSVSSVRPDSVKGRFSTTCTRSTGAGGASTCAKAAAGSRENSMRGLIITRPSEERGGADTEDGEHSEIAFGRAGAGLGQIGSPHHGRGMEKSAQLGPEADGPGEIEAHPGAELADRARVGLGGEGIAGGRAGRRAEIHRVVPEHPDAGAGERVRLKVHARFAERVDLPVDG